MSTAYQVHVVFLEKSRDDIWAKGEGNTTVVFTPASDVLVGVGPQQITEKTTVRDLRSVSKVMFVREMESVVVGAWSVYVLCYRQRKDDLHLWDA